MIDRRAKNTEIFKDTERRYKTEPILIEAVKRSRASQQFIAANDSVKPPKNNGARQAKVIVSEKRSLEAAEGYAKQGKRVCVHNFASATNPGGGVVNGALAQEECICRCTTLYPCLDSMEMWSSFYSPHRKANNPLYNDDCIYTPDVYVIKSDISFPEPLEESERYKVDIITCAAPNLRIKPSNMMNPGAGRSPARITNTQLESLLTSRVKRIFEIAAAKGEDVLILGAFGCGAFHNPPQVAAKVFHDVMKDYLSFFEVIEYAVYHRADEAANYQEFVKAMREFT